MSTKYCSKCGKQIDDSAVFCEYCGAQVGAPTRTSTNSSEPFSEFSGCENNQNQQPKTPPYEYQYTENRQNAQTQTNKINPFALVGFILSLVGGGVLSLIFSCLGLKQLGENPNQSGKGFAIAGLVISIVCIVVYVIVFGVLFTTDLYWYY